MNSEFLAFGPLKNNRQNQFKCFTCSQTNKISDHCAIFYWTKGKKCDKNNFLEMVTELITSCDKVSLQSATLHTIMLFNVTAQRKRKGVVFT